MKKFLLMLSVFGTVNAVSANESVQLRTGVILDKTTQSLVAMLPAGGVAAIDLATGNTKWASAQADKPLAIKDGRILSQQAVNQKGLLTLVYQNIANGEVQKALDLNLPRDVMAHVINGTGQNFQIANKDNQSDQLQWSFRGSKIRGAAPDSDSVLTRGTTNRQPEPRLKSGLINVNFSNLSATASDLAAQTTSIKKAIEKRVLPQIQGRQFLSQDGKHVLVSQRIADNKAIKYQWQIHTLAGESLGSLQTKESYAPFVVEGNLLLFIAPETGRFESNKLTNNSPLLIAHNLQTQSTVWQQAVRSTRYFGQRPQ